MSAWSRNGSRRRCRLSLIPRPARPNDRRGYADSLARTYYNEATTARDAGDWRTARLKLRLSMANAEIAGEPPATMAGINYEYGRASAVI